MTKLPPLLSAFLSAAFWSFISNPVCAETLSRGQVHSEIDHGTVVWTEGEAGPRDQAPWEDALPLEDGDYMLMIGNSLQGGLMNALHGPTFSEEGISYNTALIYKGARPLQVHYEDENNLTAEQGGEGYNGKGNDPKSLRDRALSSMEQILDGASVGDDAEGNDPVDGHPWDVVMLQDWRHDLADYQKFAYYVRRFDQSIRKQGGQTILFSRFPNGPLKEQRLDPYLQQLEKIDDSNVRIARELGAEVFPVSKIYLEIEKARRANAELADDDPEKKHFLPDNTDNFFREDLDGNWFEPGFLYGDGIHQAYVGKGAVYPYALYALLRRESPVGKRVPRQHVGFREDEYPELDAWVENMVWEVFKEREPWAENPNYREPERSGQVIVDYDAAQGTVILEISGHVKGVRLGSPDAQMMMEDANPQIDGHPPIDADKELMAWYVEDGTLAPGTYNLGEVVLPGTGYENLFFAYTPTEGPVGEAVQAR